MSSPTREHIRRIAQRCGLVIAGALVLQGLLVFAYRAHARLETRPNAFRATFLGGSERAPDVSFVRLGGAVATLQSLRGHVVLVHFWATWCPPCRGELPAFLDLAGSHRESVVVLLVAVRDDSTALRRFFGGSIPGDVLLDPAGHAARQFGAATFPDSFLISREGLLSHRMQGPQDWRGAAARRFLAEAVGAEH